ncbi:hypothetical protein ABFS83_10G176900 [Erythranthe nasuta]
MDIGVKFLGGVGNMLGNFAVNTTSKMVEAKVELPVEKRNGGNARNQTIPMVLLGVSISLSAVNTVWNFVLSRRRPGGAPLPDVPETRNVNIQITLTLPPPPPPPPRATKKLKIREIGGSIADDEIYQTIAITDPELLRAFMAKVMAVVNTSKDAASGEITVADEKQCLVKIPLVKKFLNSHVSGLHLVSFVWFPFFFGCKHCVTRPKNGFEVFNKDQISARGKGK